MTANQIRQMFLDYFEQRGHRVVPSSSLVPANDPTLLFINAGMNQFKEVFLGLEKRSYDRAVSSQKCVRAGGKHNDLENVGFTNRHHTFFEMLGNFSFGDYFKKEAIEYAWDLITSPDWYGIDKDKLYVTIFEGDSKVPRDDEAYQLWLEQGVAKDRIFEFGSRDNFWAMGATGPCGPCSEIFYDMGPEASDNEEHRKEGCSFPCECGRYIEIWNLVFMQFDRDGSGNLNPLPKPSIDTGAGLERLAAVLQDEVSNYDTDLFQQLIGHAAFLTFPDSDKRALTDWVTALPKRHQASLRIIADHSRAATFLISDGVIPSNEGRGYVLRKIIRRAIRHARLLGYKVPLLWEMVFMVVKSMNEAYPELSKSEDRTSQFIFEEEKRFARTLEKGMQELEDIFGVAKHIDLRAIDRFLDDFDERGKLGLQRQIEALRTEKHLAEASDEQIRISVQDAFGSVFTSDEVLDWIRKTAKKKPILAGKEAFPLYDTYGLPRDFIEDACRDQGLEFDTEGFDKAMEEQRERARASWKGKAKETASPVYQKLSQTVFEGYTQTASTECEILALVRGGQGVKELKVGEEGEAVLDHTPFYAESGGQVGDTGWFYDHGRNTLLAEVEGCTSPIQGVRTHQIKARQTLAAGDKVEAVVNAAVRNETMRNHTATHLLHSALREALGAHVKQAGSLVDPAHLRFDFSHFTNVADEELQDIEDLINREILGNQKVEVHDDVPIDVAVNELKAMALFGEKYGDRVRVIKIGNFSTELCGGIHVGHTGEIGLVKILSESSVAAGVRRVEAISGSASLRDFQKKQREAAKLAQILQVGEGNILEAAERLNTQARQAEKQLDAAKTRLALQNADDLADKAQKVKDVTYVAAGLNDVDRGALRSLVDTLRQKLGSGVVVLGTALEGKAALIVGVTKDLTNRLHAGKIIMEVAKQVGGKGGGRPDLAEAGGKEPEKLPQALAQVAAIIEKML